MNSPAVPPARLWWLLAAFVAWCVALVLVYAAHAIGCTFGWPAGALRSVLAVVVAATVLVIVWLWRNLAGREAKQDQGGPGDFLQVVAVWTTLAALVTVVFTLGPVLLVAKCV